MKGGYLLVLFVMSVSFIVIAQSPTPTPSPSLPPSISSGLQYIPEKFIVKFKETPQISGSLTSIDSINKLNRKYNVQSIKRIFEGFDSTENEIQRIKRKFPLRALRAQDIDISKIKLKNIYEFSVHKESDILSIVKEYSLNPNVEYAEPIYQRYIDYTPTNNPRYNEQWAHQKIQSEQAWDITQGNPSIVIAVIDTGVDYNHEDLKDNIWKNPGEEIGDLNGDGCPGICKVDDDGDNLIDEDSLGNSRFLNDGSLNPDWKNDIAFDDDENGFPDDVIGWNFVDENWNPVFGDNNPIDTATPGHGTHVAGIAAAVDNDRGVIGLCPKCKIMPIKGMVTEGRGVKYAIDNGADILSNSYGGPNSNQVEQDLIDYGVALGVVFVAAAGNGNGDWLHYPSSYNNVISVAATNELDERWFNSNFGEHVDVAAPGVDILSTLPNNEYGLISGTSMATPSVSGLAGLILSKNPQLTVKEVEQIIINKVDEFGVDIPMTDKYIGKGRINALKALTTIQFIRGDSNNDKKVDISDAVYLLEYLFRNGPSPECLDAADANDDGIIDISDAVKILLFLFGEGQNLPAPYPDLGVDPTADEFLC